MSRFAALDLSSDEESGNEDSHANLDPVAYTIKEINWKISEVISKLREFRVQDIYRNSHGITLRFINEHEAQKAFRHLRQACKLKFSPLNVPLLKEQICFHCGRDGHWGSDCVEGQFWTLPSELYGRIAKFIKWPDTFSFLYSSKRIFKALAPQITELYVARPHWRKLKEMTCKLGVLRYLKNVNKLTMKSISTKSIITPQMLTNLPNLRSLSIVDCSQSSGPVLSQTVLACIGRMTKLTKLDLEKQWTAIDVSHLPLLHRLTNLTQLRLSIDGNKLTGQLTELTVLGNLKKLGVNFVGPYYDVTLPDKLLMNLTSLNITRYGSVTLPPSLPALKQLNIRAIQGNVRGLKSAPNLIKLKWHCTGSIITIEDCTSSLLSYTKAFNQEQKVPVRIQMPLLRKLVVEGPVQNLTLDLGGAVSLKRLVLSDTAETKIVNAPASLQEIIAVPPYNLDMLFSEEDWTKLNLRSFQLLTVASCYHRTPADTAKLFRCLQGCSTLRNLKLESLPEVYFKHLTSFTWLEELDLVNSTVTKQISQGSMLELSRALPNTRITYGYQPSTLTKREGSNHWRSIVFRESDPFDD